MATRVRPVVTIVAQMSLPPPARNDQAPVRACLERARARIADVNHWRRDGVATDAHGKEVSARRRTADRWTLWGAVVAEIADAESANVVLDALRLLGELVPCGYRGLVDFGRRASHAEVIGLVERAMGEARK